MGASVKVNPQVKVTCKRISPKANIESVDKRFVDEYKSLLEKYELTVRRLAQYDGAVDEEGYAEDKDDYLAWKNSHPNIISKKSVNNLFRKIKNKSRLDYDINYTAVGTVFNAGVIEGNNFVIQIVHTLVYPGAGAITSFAIMYYDNVLDIKTANVNIEG